MTQRSIYRLLPIARIKNAIVRRRRRLAYAAIFALCVLFALSLLLATVTRSSSFTVAAILALSIVLAGTAYELGRLRRRIKRAETAQTKLVVALHDRSRGGDTAIPADFLKPIVRNHLDKGEVLEVYGLVSESLGELGVAELRRLRNELRKRGYLAKAHTVAQVCAARGKQPQDRDVLRLIAGEIAVLSGSLELSVRPEAPGFEPRAGRILHVVGSSLPHTQSGYTLRTHYTVLAQRQTGLDPHVVTQMGFGVDGDEYIREEVDGIVYHRIPGPARGSEPLDVWLRKHTQRVANVVRVVRPAALHAASDFLNALTAEVVGEEFGIPVIYESRGFWEETWLQRQAETFGWGNLGDLEATHGMPDVYVWRRQIEDRCRRSAAHVVTLAEVMAERIEAGGVPQERITVVPNGVDVEAFPKLNRNQRLAAELGISSGTIVIGYISSIVEYEGIDTLIDAYAQVRKTATQPLTLLIVGDGAERERLTQQATSLGLDDVIFTGRVSHDAVIDYYSLIDIFVVPRKPVEVCHLVTPLKPFEAFSTGRTVVLSNVQALARIAEQSKAAELFEAGNPAALANTLTTLITDPTRRQELADKGADWVRAKRTWTANADTYTHIYEKTGALPLGEFSVPRLDISQVNVSSLRASLVKRSALPFEELTKDDQPTRADEVMSRGWVVGSHPAVLLEIPIDWETLCQSNRSWNFRLHAWDFMGPPLARFARTGERTYLDWCIDRAVSWGERFNDGENHGTMAWYDMALGLRGHRLAYLTEQAVMLGTDPKKVSKLLQCVIRHQKEYFEQRAFNPRTNHGVFVALGQIAFARRLKDMPGMRAIEAQGRGRLELMVRTQFAADGGHLEHSPDYHRMLLESFSRAMAAGLLDATSIQQWVEAAEEVLGWFIQPNGELVQIGDSVTVQMRSARIAVTNNPATEFLMSEGRRGTPNPDTLRVLPDAGYAIVRSPQPSSQDDHSRSSYLILAAGFHSRTHKHADDLTICWFDRGHEILIDAGRYGYVDLLPADSPLRQQGYFYSAPERQFVEATRAHNTIEADGNDHVRRGRDPYGSAISKAEERDGYYLMRAEVNHGTWKHKRSIVLLPNQWLYIVDGVASQNGSVHDFRSWWNLPAELAPAASPHGGLQAQMPSGETLWITQYSDASLIPPVTAGRNPLRGWRSKLDLDFTPAWSTGFVAQQVRKHQFATLFSFGERPSRTTPEHPFRHEIEPLPTMTADSWI